MCDEAARSATELQANQAAIHHSSHPRYYTREWATRDIGSALLVSFVVTAHLPNLGVC